MDIDPTHVQVQVWAQVQIFKYGWFPTLHTTCMLFIYREGAVGGAGLVGWGVVLLAWIGVKASPKPCTCGLEVTFNPRHKTWDIVPHVCTSTPCFCMTRCIYFQLALFACTTFGHSLFTSPCFFFVKSRDWTSHLLASTSLVVFAIFSSCVAGPFTLVLVRSTRAWWLDMLLLLMPAKPIVGWEDGWRRLLDE